MFNGNSAPSLADIAAVTGNSRSNNDGMWGGDGWWAIIIFAIIFGWGGFGGFGGGYGNGAGTAAMSGYATQADLMRGFDNSNIVSKLDGITNGLCDGFYAMNNTMQSGFNAQNVANLQGFNAVQQAISAASTADLQNTYAVQQAINADTVANMQNTNALSSQLATCCCENREAIADVKYQMATDTCAVQNSIQNATRDITDNANSNTRSILDFLVNDKIATLTAENQSLKFQASQSAQNSYLSALAEAQTAEILRRTAPLPVPSFPASNLYGYYNACGCGSCSG